MLSLRLDVSGNSRALLTLLFGLGCVEPEETTSAIEAASLGAPVDDLADITPIPHEVAVDTELVALGARLFVDPGLSHDGTVACVACHDFASGGDEGSIASHLAGRERGAINVPSIFNVRFLSRLSWSGRWERMEDQIDAAMRAPHSLATETEAAVERIRPRYADDFRRVFPSEGLTPATFRRALGEYIFSLITPGAPFDRFLEGDDAALSASEREGWRLFRDYGCISCHQGRNIGGNLFERFGVLEDYFAGRTDLSRADLGRFAVTEREEDRHVFRVPSLRNVALTPPYFHDGSAATLEEAVEVMGRYQLGRRLEPTETASLVAFLGSLTGRAPEGGGR